MGMRHPRNDERGIPCWPRCGIAGAIPRRSGEPGTNPEQLFAAGYAACFQSALFAVAAGRKLDASDSQIICRVGFGPTGHDGFGPPTWGRGLGGDDAVAEPFRGPWRLW